MEYAAEQLSAGFRAMTMLSGLVRRGGRPAAVVPTVPLRPREKQYGWFPVTVDGVGREIAVITSQRLIVQQDIPLREIGKVRPVPGEWSVALECSTGTLTLSGPWIPWMTVVICAELYGTPWPPTAVIPEPASAQVFASASRPLVVATFAPVPVSGSPAAVPGPRREINTRTARKKLMAPMDCAVRGLRR